MENEAVWWFDFERSRIIFYVDLSKFRMEIPHLQPIRDCSSGRHDQYRNGNHPNFDSPIWTNLWIYDLVANYIGDYEENFFIKQREGNFSLDVIIHDNYPFFACPKVKRMSFCELFGILFVEFTFFQNESRHRNQWLQWLKSVLTF